LSYKKIISFILLASSHISTTLALELSSPSQQASLLELYTSEGCSSCPAADHWLSQLKQDKRLWQKIVPVAFHVDYWNFLGWKDRFSQTAYSQRQRNYKKHGYLNVVYTPGFVKNGREWRGWFDKQPLHHDSNDVGILQASINNTSNHASFTPATPMQAPLLLNVALLGFDQSTDIANGENRGKRLVHDFVVLEFRQYPQQANQQGYHWSLENDLLKTSTNASGIALWLTRPNDPTPIQATGGFFDVNEL